MSVAGLNRVWITRTQPGAQNSAQAVRALGLTPVIAPLLRITATGRDAAAPLDNDALAFTSANGARAFAALSDKRDYDVYCVGSATAQQAGAIGFTRIHNASGNVDALAALIKTRGAAQIIHYSGVHVAGDLTGALRAAGINARREIIYGTQAVTETPTEASDIIKDGGFVLLHSPKAAQTLMRLLPPADMARLYAVSLSKNIDACLTEGFAGRFIATAPHERALMEALEKARLAA